jgi:GNAT superfamily N-acetyltransferase
MTRSPEPTTDITSRAEPVAGSPVRLPPITEHFGVAFRSATPDDLPACAAVWRESINDYLAPRNLHLIPDELGPITRLYRHLQATDPSRFVVATRDVKDGAAHERIVGFASAVERERLWLLSMLFVRPGEQGRGLGRALLDRVMPADVTGQILATATDSMQRISNALYASLGIVARMPLFSLVGRPERPGALEPLPQGVTASPIDPADFATIDALDSEVLGFTHRIDHDYLVGEGRQGFLYRSAAGEPLGYGYTSAVGRVGPVAVREEQLLWPLVSHLLTAVEPRGASAVWAPGAAGRTVRGLLHSGLRLEDYPILVCWSEPFADFSRYVPISPGLL